MCHSLFDKLSDPKVRIKTGLVGAVLIFYHYICIYTFFLLAYQLSLFTLLYIDIYIDLEINKIFVICERKKRENAQWDGTTYTSTQFIGRLSRSRARGFFCPKERSMKRIEPICNWQMPSKWFRLVDKNLLRQILKCEYKLYFKVQHMQNLVRGIPSMVISTISTILIDGISTRSHVEHCTCSISLDFLWSQ